MIPEDGLKFLEMMVEGMGRDLARMVGEPAATNAVLYVPPELGRRLRESRIGTVAGRPWTVAPTMMDTMPGDLSIVPLELHVQFVQRSYIPEAALR